MKCQVVIVLWIIVLCSCAVNRQQLTHTKGYRNLAKFRSDTAAYVMANYVKHKSNYIGKPISLFLNDWELPVKSYLFGPGAKLVTDKLIISGNTNNELNERVGTGKQYRTVTIILTEPIDGPEFNNMLQQSRLSWTPEAKVFFSKQIVKDLLVDDYLKKQ